MASGSVVKKAIVDCGKITEGTVIPSTADNSDTAFNVTFGKTFPAVPTIFTSVYSQTRFTDRAMYVSKITNLSTSGCTIHVVNPYSTAYTLTDTRHVAWMAVLT